MTIFSDLATAPATHAEAQARLSAFMPHAAGDYAQWRNHDFGPTGNNRVSALSPWLRHRLISEAAVVEATIRQHGLEAAEKFIQEVCWRSYWKGYLERRPVHWRDYRTACKEDQAAVSKDHALARRLEEAMEGVTGIGCFDAWAAELKQNGYLHNHARMWFASIWVFTLELPWTLGADFFLRRLLDGDPASNTLSWRWVAGQHTQGKNYLARPENIARFTNGRFNPAGQLVTDVDLPALTEKPPIGPSPTPVPWERSANTGLLITEEDLTPEEIFGSQDWPLVIAVQTTSWRSNRPIGDAAMRFAHEGLIDSLTRNPGAITHGPMRLDTQEATAQLCQRLREAGIQHLLTPWIPTGPTAEALSHVREHLTSAGITLQAVPRRWDVDLWPAATHGFFRFWKAAQNYLATV